MDDIEAPWCMTEDELELWKAQAEYVRQWGTTNTADPCFDCLPSFADEMRAVGRCNGTPGVARPVPTLEEIEEARRESNRRCQQRYRERHQERIRERRRAYFRDYKAEWRKRSEVDERSSGAA